MIYFLVCATARCTTGICFRTRLVQYLSYFVLNIPFYVYLTNLLYSFRCDVCNFVGDTTPYVSDKNLDFVLTKLEEHSIILLILNGLRMII